MASPLILILTSIIASLIFIFFIVTAIIKKNPLRLIFSLIFLVIAIGSLVFLGTYAASRASSKLTQTIDKLKQNFKPRTGSQIYFALFGKPNDSCLIVIHEKDQNVPRLDCCIWLEFQTCPSELNRIIAKESFTTKRYIAKDTLNYLPDYSPRPEWWRPNLLDDSINVSRNYNIDNPNRDKILIFAKDSSRAFYCDMAD